MSQTPESIARFLTARRIAVAGASRDRNQPANAIMRRLRASGYEVVPVNPNATEVEGLPCYPDISAVPGSVEAVMIVTHPDVSAAVVRQCSVVGIDRVWFHRSFGSGSVSREAVEACHDNSIECIVGGCPMMFCGPVDLGHRCMKWWLQRKGRVPV